MKKGEPSRSRDNDKDNDKDKREALPRDEDHTSQCSSSVIREIKTIIGRPSIGGLFRSFKKSYQRQVNNVHKIPSLK